MSIHVQSKAWKATGLTMAEKLVLVKLADNANDQGRCWPSIARMAEECCCDRRTIMRSINALIEAGHVKRTRRPGANTLYAVLPGAESHPGQRVTSDSEALPGAESHHHPGQRVTLPGAQCPTNHQEPSKEPSKEPSITPNPKSDKKPKLGKTFDDLPELRKRIIRILNPKTTRMPRPAIEETAWKKIKDHVTEEDVALVEKFYRVPKSKEFDVTWHRKEAVAQLMNQWVSQVEHAESCKTKAPDDYSNAGDWGT